MGPTMKLEPGQLWKSKCHGLLRFDRWDTFHGEVTAEFTMLDYQGRKTWILPGRLKNELEPLV